MTLELPDMRVAVAGDWHGQPAWAAHALTAIRAASPSVRTVLQLGDFWASAAMVETVEAFCEKLDLTVYVTVGNHDLHGEYEAYWVEHPGEPIQLSPHVIVLPRPYRMRIGGREVLSLGGAASVDRLWRSPREWWPEEVISDEQVGQAIAGGPADVMLTHESPDVHATPVVKRILWSNPHGWPAITLRESTQSRQQVDRVFDSTGARMLLHGHMHAPDEGMTADGRRVISLGCNGQARNVVLLTMRTLRLETVKVVA